MKRQLYYLLSAPMRLLVRRIYYLPLDLFETMTRKRPEGVPPRGMVFVGYGDYVKQGKKFLEYFKTLAGLKPDHHVLDVGCGIGRMAYPLTAYLTEKGSYDGFDIVKSGIDWCRKNISRKHPNFRFIHTGLYNQLYNTGAKTGAGRFVFPYEGNSFDFVFLTSVFTHMMPDEVENYIGQISRVMKPGATCLVSFFLINEESENLMKLHPTHMNFPVNKGFYRLHSIQVDTANVAYDESWVREKMNSQGIGIEAIHYGQWCDRSSFTDYQDLVICRKRS
jgi:SAM-dependent methyltransferase